MDLVIAYAEVHYLEQLLGQMCDADLRFVTHQIRKQEVQGLGWTVDQLQRAERRREALVQRFLALGKESYE